MIDCVVEGDPKPTIQWDKNLKMNDFDKTRLVLEFHLFNQFRNMASGCSKSFG